MGVYFLFCSICEWFAAVESCMWVFESDAFLNFCIRDVVGKVVLWGNKSTMGEEDKRQNPSDASIF